MTADDAQPPQPKRRDTGRGMRSRRPASESLSAPTLGYIPTGSRSPAPTLAEPDGAAAHAYSSALDRLGAATKQQVFTITSAGREAAATTVALNLAIAATRAGLRAVLIDGDPTGDGPSQFLRTGDGPGLSDLAAGTADLQGASRLLSIDENQQLPVIPSGTAEDSFDFDSADLADPIDRIGEISDLVLIDLPAGLSPRSMAALGAHAHGTILVISSRQSGKILTEAADRMAEVGVPVVGIIERADGDRKSRRRRKS